MFKTKQHYSGNVADVGTCTPRLNAEPVEQYSEIFLFCLYRTMAILDLAAKSDVDPGTTNFTLAVREIRIARYQQPEADAEIFANGVNWMQIMQETRNAGFSATLSWATDIA